MTSLSAKTVLTLTTFFRMYHLGLKSVLVMRLAHHLDPREETSVVEMLDVEVVERLVATEKLLTVIIMTVVVSEVEMTIGIKPTDGCRITNQISTFLFFINDWFTCLRITVFLNYSNNILFIFLV